MTKGEIVEIRRSLRMTQEQLAQLLGIHALTVSKWERGLSSPTPHQEALLRAAAGAVRQRPDIGAVVAAALVGAGVGIALFQLLGAAFSPSPTSSAAATEASGTAPTERAGADAVHNDDVTTTSSSPPTAARSARHRSRLPPRPSRTLQGLRRSPRRSSSRGRAPAVPSPGT